MVSLIQHLQTAYVSWCSPTLAYAHDDCAVRAACVNVRFPYSPATGDARAFEVRRPRTFSITSSPFHII